MDRRQRQQERFSFRFRNLLLLSLLCFVCFCLGFDVGVADDCVVSRHPQRYLFLTVLKMWERSGTSLDKRGFYSAHDRTRRNHYRFTMASIKKMLSLYVLSLICTDEYLKLLGLGVFFFFFFSKLSFCWRDVWGEKNVCRKRCKVLIASLLESEDTALVLFERKVKQRQPRRGEKLQALSSASTRNGGGG